MKILIIFPALTRGLAYMRIAARPPKNARYLVTNIHLNWLNGIGIVLIIIHYEFFNVRITYKNDIKQQAFNFL
jgi:hypothetical protein